MTKYTITAAGFANEDHTAAIIMTREAGAVLVSEADTPDVWPDVIAAKPLAFSPPTTPPVRAVTDLQFRLALNAAGLRAAAEAHVVTAGRDTQDWWDRAVTIRRDSPMIEAARLALGKSEADLDALFAAAAGF